MLVFISTDQEGRGRDHYLRRRRRLKERKKERKNNEIKEKGEMAREKKS